MQQVYYVRPHDVHNETLMQNVHPAGWKNPEPATCYNLVVLGAGTAGLVTAAGAAGLGAKVALVERSLMGGDCLNVGCVPSKGIIRSARAVYDMRIVGEFGMTRNRDLSVNFGKVMERMRRLRAGISIHDSAERFSKELGVDVFFGEGKFGGSDVIDVEGKLLRFKKAAICTGARAAVPSIPGLEKMGYLTNETIFQITKLPRRLVVIGGGPIGCELAQTFARLGSRVSLLEQSSRILPREDVDASAFVYRSLLRDGVDLRLQVKILKASKRGRGKIVTIDENGVKADLPADEVFVGVGRTPNVEHIDLEKAGIAYDLLNGVTVNDYLRTTNPRVYAAGDICSPHKFTHTADAMARIVIANALFMAKHKISRLVMPWCTYTDPEVAHVGLYEKDAREQGVDVFTLTVPLSDVDRAQLDGETEGFVRVHLKKGSDKILGATIVARHAGEMMSELSLAMTAHLGLSAIGKTIHPYPTQAEAIKKAADSYSRMRLTPFVKKLFVAWLKWLRS